MVKGAVKRVASSETRSRRTVCPFVVVKTRYKISENFGHPVNWRYLQQWIAADDTLEAILFGIPPKEILIKLESV